jgi:hypothetical protein
MDLVKHLASVASAVAILQGCTLIKTIAHNFPDLHDHRNFASRTLDFARYGRLHLHKFSETKRQDPLPLFRAIVRALKRPENIAELDRLGGQTYALHSPNERRTP